MKLRHLIIFRSPPGWEHIPKSDQLRIWRHFLWRLPKHPIQLLLFVLLFISPYILVKALHIYAGHAAENMEAQAAAAVDTAGVNPWFDRLMVILVFATVLHIPALWITFVVGYNSILHPILRQQMAIDGYPACECCGYLLRGLPSPVDRCPECGHEVQRIKE